MVVVVVVVIIAVVVVIVVVVAAVVLRGRIFCFYLCLLNTNYMYIFVSNR